MQLDDRDKVSIKPDMGKVKVLVFVSSVLLVVSVNLLYVVVLGGVFSFEITISDLLLSLVLFFVLFFMGLLLHELVHVIGFLLFAGAGFSDIKVGFKYCSPFVHCSKVVEVGGFRLAIILPVFLTAVVPMVGGFLVNSFMLMNVGCLLTAGGLGDVIGFIYMLRVPGDALVYDYVDELGSDVYLPRERV